MKKNLFICLIIIFASTFLSAQQNSAFYAEYRHEFSKVDGWYYSKYVIQAMGKICFIKNETYNISGIVYLRQTERVSWTSAPSVALGGVEFSMKYTAFQFLAGVNNSNLEGTKGRGKFLMFLGETSPNKNFLKTYIMASIEGGGPTGWYTEGKVHFLLTEWLAMGFVIDRNERDDTNSDTGYGPRIDFTLPDTPIRVFGELKWRWQDTNRDNIIGVAGVRLTF